MFGQSSPCIHGGHEDRPRRWGTPPRVPDSGLQPNPVSWPLASPRAAVAASPAPSGRLPPPPAVHLCSSVRPAFVDAAAAQSNDAVKCPCHLLPSCCPSPPPVASAGPHRRQPSVSTPRFSLASSGMGGGGSPGCHPTPALRSTHLAAPAGRGHPSREPLRPPRPPWPTPVKLLPGAWACSDGCRGLS